MRLFSCSSLVLVGLGLYCALVAQNLAVFWFPPVCEDPAAQHCIHPLFPAGKLVDVHVFVGNVQAADTSQLVPAFSFHNHSTDAEVAGEFDVPVPPHVRRNGSLTAHVFLTSAGRSPLQSNSTFRAKSTIYARARLTRHMLPLHRNKSLLLGPAGDAPGSSQAAEAFEEEYETGSWPTTHWRRSLGLRFVNDQTVFSSRTAPGDVPLQAVSFKGRHHYKPVVYADELTMLRTDWRVMSTNVSRTTARLEFTLRPISLGQYRLLQQLQHTLAMLETQLGFSEQDVDDVKALFAQRMYILVLTWGISILHMVFDFLAFKNDIGFWKGRKDLSGLSKRTVILNCVCTAIILLNLLDNADQTSILVLGSMGVSFLIELWKVTKVLKVSLSWNSALPSMTHRQARSKGEEATESFDREAMRYLSWALYPLMVAQAVYLLVYTPHRSWYSWVVKSLSNGVYLFGFALMMPQLYINWKLKSVAHLPWRVFMYKAFNTFIDDVFAFVVVMPIEHRVACLRDDLVFFVYLYQRWLYPVDMKRVNEFGICYELDDADSKDRPRQEQAQPPPEALEGAKPKTD